MSDTQLGRLNGRTYILRHEDLNHDGVIQNDEPAVIVVRNSRGEERTYGIEELTEEMRQELWRLRVDLAGRYPFRAVPIRQDHIQDRLRRGNFRPAGSEIVWISDGRLEVGHRSSSLCRHGLVGGYSSYFGVPLGADVHRVYEGDANHDGHRDYFVILTTGAAILLQGNRNAVRTCARPPETLRIP